MITPPSPPARLLVAYSEKHVKSPIDPTLRSPTVASTACAASSITSSECSRAIAHSASMSHGPPAKCTGSTARVRGPTSARTASGSMFSVSASTSANTGVAPACSTAFVVAGHVNDVVITSSPSPSPAATIARCSAAVHDDVAIAWPVPDPRREPLLQLARPRPAGQPARPQRLDHRRDLLVTQHRRRERQHAVAHGRAAVDGQGCGYGAAHATSNRTASTAVRARWSASCRVVPCAITYPARSVAVRRGPYRCPAA